MQTLKVNKGRLKTSVLLPPSKSYANRALILACLKPGKFSLKNLPNASDVSNLVSCLESVGLKLHLHESQLDVMNSFPDCDSDACDLYPGEGGTTARFLACLLLLGKKEYRLHLGMRLRDRPWDDFLSMAKLTGAEASLKGGVLSIKGPASFPGVVEADCSKTTQFATGLQLLTLTHSFKTNPVHLNSSVSYWRMTEKMLETFRSSSEFFVPIDWSSASYPMAFAALEHPIFFPNLKDDPLQADSKFLQVLKRYGCIEENEQGISVSPVKNHFSLEYDVSDCLDLVPALAFFLAHIEGKHVLRGISNLVHKESDRLNEVARLVQIFGREVSFSSTALVISGRKDLQLPAQDLIFPDDHRMVMTGALFLRHHSGGSLAPSEAVAKSWPDFFTIMDV